MLRFVLIFLSVTFFVSRLYIRFRYMKWKAKLRYREQLLLSLIGVAIAGVIVGGQYLYQRWYYTPAPTPYATMDEAEADGCIVINAPHFLERGRERWEQFFGVTNFGIPDNIKIAVWDGGESQVVNTILYDGEQYHYTTNNGLKHSDSVTTSYPYLLHLRHEPAPEENMMYHWKESYILTDKADLTGTEYENRWLDGSPSFRWVEIIADYKWKDDP